MGWSGPSACAKPSTVVTSRPCAATARVRHARVRRPSTSTVQAPHWPWSQPFLDPVSPMWSRRASSSVVRTSRPTRYISPLIDSFTSTGACGSGDGMVWAAACPAAATPTRGKAAVEAVAPRNRRRLTDAGRSSSLWFVMAASAGCLDRSMRTRARDRPAHVASSWIPSLSFFGAFPRRTGPGHGRLPSLIGRDFAVRRSSVGMSATYTAPWRGPSTLVMRRPADAHRRPDPVRAGEGCRAGRDRS